MAATEEATTVVWEGANALRPFLVAIDDLHPFPGNPRRGDLDVVRASLKRFGQTKQVLYWLVPEDADDAPELAGLKVLVAGHHMTEAARMEGWTHVGALPHEFAGLEEARAFLLTDNRSSDLGSYDMEALHRQLKEAQDAPAGLEGTGYPESYVDQLARDLEAFRARVEAPEQFPVLDPATLETAYRCPSCHYEWSGNPRPGAEADQPPDPVDDEDNADA